MSEQDTSGLLIPNVAQLGGDTIDQIPLGVQVYPWDDMNPAAKPSRGPSYPDDILPTSALLVGQNGQNVQTVETDGNHAAKVYVVNESGGGGGGGGTPVQYSAEFDTTTRDIQNNNDDLGALSSFTSCIYNYNYSVAITRAITATDKTAGIGCYLKVPGLFQFYRLFHLMFSSLGNNFTQNGNAQMVNPIDLIATFGTAAGVHVYCYGDVSFYSLNISINGV